MPARTPVILCPLHFERKALLRHGLGQHVTIETCGPGREGVARWAGRNRKPDRPVILAGVAGALVEEFEIGDVVLVDAVVAAGGKRIQTTWRPSGVDIPVVSSTSKTRTVTSRPGKLSLHAVTTGAIVDLESQTFAEIGQELGWDFGIIRGISDTLDSPLPPGCDNWVDHHGRAAARPIMASLLRSPSLILRMRELKRASESAMSNVARVLKDVLEPES